MEDKVKVKESEHVGMTASVEDGLKWHCHTLLEKFDEDGNLYETVEIDGNALMTAGASIIWDLVTANGGKAFNPTNAAIGVGNSSTAAAVGQTDLQGSSKLRKPMTGSDYPNHTSTTSILVFQSQFTDNEANFAWNEWGIFNSGTNASGDTMLNRKVKSLGTKAAGTTWQLTVSLQLA